MAGIKVETVAQHEANGLRLSPAAGGEGFVLERLPVEGRRDAVVLAAGSAAEIAAFADTVVALCRAGLPRVRRTRRKRGPAPESQAA